MKENFKNVIGKPFVSPDGQEVNKEVFVEYKDGSNKTFNLNIPKVPDSQDEFETFMRNRLDKFENDSWTYETNILDSGFDNINRVLEGGIKPGFYIIAADSNVGKSILQQQLGRQIAERNENAMVLDFSLDDAVDDRLSRGIASYSKVIINSVKNPNKYSQYPNMLLRRLHGLTFFRNIVDRYIVFDSEDGTDIEFIEEKIIKAKINADMKNIDKRIVVLIDGFHDLTIKAHPNYQDNQKYEYLATAIANLAKQYNIPIICTAEIKKVNGAFRPMPDHIREASKIKYQAKCIIMCYSDVHYKGEGAEIFFNRSDKEEKQPVLEAHFAKNKLSSFKGRLFFESYPELARVEEASLESSKNYLSLIQ